MVSRVREREGKKEASGVMDDHTYYNKADVMRVLNSRIMEAGSVRKFCDLHELSELVVGDAIRFNHVEGKVLAALGLREVKVYERLI